MSRTVRIYQPAKTAMQSGRGKTRRWLLEHVSDAPMTPDPLMGWPTMSDTTPQIKLFFKTRDEAVTYAKAKGFIYEVAEPHTPITQPKSYAENFAFGKRK